MIDVILLASIVAFLKQQIGLTGKAVILLAIAIGSLFWFSADITAFSPILGGILNYLKFILSTPGLFDLVVNVGQKIKKIESVY